MTDLEYLEVVEGVSQIGTAGRGVLELEETDFEHLLVSTLEVEEAGFDSMQEVDTESLVVAERILDIQGADFGIWGMEVEAYVLARLWGMAVEGAHFQNLQVVGGMLVGEERHLEVFGGLQETVWAGFA